MKDLLAEARRYGARIVIAPMPAGYRGHYDERRREIIVSISLSMPELKEAIAHEVAHARYCHECTDELTEAKAWRYAARILVPLESYRQAEAIDSEPAAIAEELGVPERIIRIFQREWAPTLALSRGA